MSFDHDALDVLRTVPSERTVLRKAICGGCGRSMHKTPLIVGAPTEWRHDSSGATVSWSPQRHMANVERVPAHAHRWGPQEGGMRLCTVSGCDSELLERVVVHEAPKLTEKEAHKAESRRRGGEVRRALHQKAKPGKKSGVNDPSGETAA